MIIITLLIFFLGIVTLISFVNEIFTVEKDKASTALPIRAKAFYETTKKYYIIVLITGVEFLLLLLFVKKFFPNFYFLPIKPLPSSYEVDPSESDISTFIFAIPLVITLWLLEQWLFKKS